MILYYNSEFKNIPADSKVGVERDSISFAAEVSLLYVEVQPWNPFQYLQKAWDIAD